MSKQKTRQRAKRRDRRKAKESNFRRAGRSNPRRVGHGGSGQMTRGVIMGPTKTKRLDIEKTELSTWGELLGDYLRDIDQTPL